MTLLRCVLAILLCGTLPGQERPDPKRRMQVIREIMLRGGQVSAEDREFMREQQLEFPKTHPARESTGLVPLPDLGAGKYKGEEGGLYPGRGNTPPRKHLEAGLKIARAIVPLDAKGEPSQDGKIVLLSVGMSNTTMEFQTFQKMAREDPSLNPHLEIVDGAQGGQTARVTAKPQSKYWTVNEERLRKEGVTSRQVQVAWIKQANGMPMGESEEEIRTLADDVAGTVRALREKCPNVKIVYLSSRIYGGYAATPLNPEPYAYEGGFAMKHVIADQMAGKLELPWLAWGPYLWTDGLKGRRQDDVVWKREDVGQDGTHPSNTGREKVARMLLEFLKKDATARPWFLK